MDRLDNIFAHKIILCSHSPRRKALLEDLGFNVEVKTIETEEDYPITISSKDVPAYLAQKKLHAFDGLLEEEDILLAADTVVLLGNSILGKPKDSEDAVSMLKNLSGKEHIVISGHCMRFNGKERTFSQESKVRFSSMSEEEIRYYVQKYHPIDKAGSYGIQEWIGMAMIDEISGDFYNIMGLSTHNVYANIREMLW